MRTKRTLRVLGIESSCDETAAAVVRVESRESRVERNRRTFSFDVQASVVASQVDIHAQYGGVVPEVAARAHVVKIMPVIEAALRIFASLDTLPPRSKPFERGRSTALAHRDRRGGALSPPVGRQGVKPCPTGIDAIAVTAGPGLMTSLAVGVETARTLAVAWGKPLIAVNHIEGHVLSSLLSSAQNLKSQISNLKFPALALIVSGGHTELLLMRRWGQYRCIGATRDDAAGEAFDKVGKLLGLPYPGGPAVARAAAGGDPAAFDFPRPMMESDDFEFSFSGLKTAVRYFVEKHQEPNSKFQTSTKHKIPITSFIADVCASFQLAVVDALVAKTVRAAEQYGAKTVLLGGGVAANAALRLQLGATLAARLPTTDYRLPTPAFCGDNAAMIAAAGGVRLLLGQQTPWDRLQANANWELGR